MATHSGSLAWKTPWTEEPGRLQSMGSQRVGHDWATLLCFQSGANKPSWVNAFLPALKEQPAYNEEGGDRVALTNFPRVAAQEVSVYEEADDEEEDARRGGQGAQRAHYPAQRHLKDSETRRGGSAARTEPRTGGAQAERPRAACGPGAGAWPLWASGPRPQKGGGPVNWP